MLLFVSVRFFFETNPLVPISSVLMRRSPASYSLPATGVNLCIQSPVSGLLSAKSFPPYRTLRRRFWLSRRLIAFGTAQLVAMTRIDEFKRSLSIATLVNGFFANDLPCFTLQAFKTSPRYHLFRSSKGHYMHVRMLE